MTELNENHFFRKHGPEGLLPEASTQYLRGEDFVQVSVGTADGHAAVKVSYVANSAFAREVLEKLPGARTQTQRYVMVTDTVLVQPFDGVNDGSILNKVMVDTDKLVQELGGKRRLSFVERVTQNPDQRDRLIAGITESLEGTLALLNPSTVPEAGKLAQRMVDYTILPELHPDGPQASPIKIVTPKRYLDSLKRDIGSTNERITTGIASELMHYIDDRATRQTIAQQLVDRYVMPEHERKAPTVA